MPAENPFVGETLNLESPPNRTAVIQNNGGSPRANFLPDGTEWTVALFALGALGFLALLEVGGFKTVLAASISTR